MASTQSPPLVISGSGRSGTTWILDALANANGLRAVFEPLHPIGVPAAAPFANTYLPADAEHAALEALLGDVFFGSFNALWPNYRMLAERLRPGKGNRAWVPVRRWAKFGRQYLRYRGGLRHPRRITKFIRANLMLRWLQAKFDARIVCVLRHPCVVIESQLRLGGADWDPNAALARYRSAQRLPGTYLPRYAELLVEPLPAAATAALVWCLENDLVLDEASSGAYSVHYYEDLLQDPRREWARMTLALGLAHAPEKDVLQRPSQQAAPGRRRRQPSIMRAHEVALERLGGANVADVQRVLDLAGFDAYRVDVPTPTRRVATQEAAASATSQESDD